MVRMFFFSVGLFNDASCLFQQKIPRPQLSQGVLREGELCKLHPERKNFAPQLALHISIDSFFLFVVAFVKCMTVFVPGKRAPAASELCR